MKRSDRLFEGGVASRVLDIGGTPGIWRFSRAGFQVTLLNLGESGARAGASDLGYVTGSALALPLRLAIVLHRLTQPLGPDA
jgi:hypothetical protein